MKIKINESYVATKDFKILGYLGEINARTIEVEHPTVDGADTYRLRFEYSDGVGYDVPLTDGKVTLEASVLRLAGNVDVQWLATKAAQNGYSTVVKSNVFKLQISESIGDSGAIPTPETALTALDKISAQLEQSSENAEKAETAQKAAEESCEKALTAETNAAAAAETAQTAASNAASSASEAQTAAEAAQKAAEEAAAVGGASDEQIAAAVNTYMTENPIETTEITDGSITPEKTSFFTESEVEYEIVEGKKINLYGSALVDDETAFAVFIKIPDDYAYIATTPSNAVAGSIKSCRADENKNVTGYSGWTDTENKYTTFSKILLSDETAKYFVVSYAVGTQFEIIIGRGKSVNYNTYMPLSTTELSSDFLLESKNRVSGFSKIFSSADSSGWRYTGRLCTDLFSVVNGEKLYHNGTALKFAFFDENYSFLSSAAMTSGSPVDVDNTVKYACAYISGGSVSDDLWISDSVLTDDELKSDTVINAKYLPQTVNVLKNSPLIFNIDFKGDVTEDDIALITNYNADSKDDAGYTLPSFDNRLTISKLCVCDNIAVKSIVTLTSTNCNILFSSSDVYGGSRASMVQFDFANGTINIAPASDGTAILETILQTADMSAVIDDNLMYVLEIGRKQRELYAKITNYKTGVSVQSVVSEDDLQNYKYPAGWLYDEPTISLISGDSVKLERMYCQIKQYDVVLLGDSITEGYGVPYADCWAHQVGEWIGKPYVIMGRAGGQVNCLDRQVDEILPYIKPEYVVITVGTNSGNTINNLTTLMYKIRKLGASPILNYICTMSNSSSSQNVNNVISELGEHGTRFDLATAIDNDVTNGQNSTLFQNDKLHPNAAGHTACFERFKLDCDFLSD